MNATKLKGASQDHWRIDCSTSYALWAEPITTEIQAAQVGTVYRFNWRVDGINVPKFGSMVTKYFFQTLPNKGKVYATKICHYLLMTRLACDQLGAYFLCHNHVPVFYH